MCSQSTISFQFLCGRDTVLIDISMNSSSNVEFDNCSVLDLQMYYIILAEVLSFDHNHVMFVDTILTFQHFFEVFVLRSPTFALRYFLK